MNRILNFIKSLFKHNNKKISKEDLNYQKLYAIQNLLANVEIGDIIWAKRYNNDTELSLIPLGHQEGPFIVLGKSDKGLICSYGTSTISTEDLTLSPNEYNLSKITHFKLKYLIIIDDYSFIRKIDRLTDNDIDLFFKKIKSIIQDYTYIDDKIKLNLPVQVGDIISCENENYLILDIEENKLRCIKIETSINNIKGTLKLKYFNDLDYMKIKYLKLNQNISYLNSVNNNILLYILKNEKKYLEYSENKETPQRGSVIFKDKKYYYIYGEEGQYFNVFEINEKINNQYDMLKINEIKFYTNYNSVKINKKDTFEVCCLATPNEIDEIRRQKKSYSKINKYKVKTMPRNLFKIGDIIKSKKFKDRFIIISICKKTYKCLSINNLKKGIYYSILIKKEEVKYSDDVNLNGIKWFEENKNFKLENISTGNTVEIILETQNRFIEQSGINMNLDINTFQSEKTNCSSICIGNVIEKDSKYYYVYKKEENNLIVFEMSENYSDNLNEIIIQNKRFYISFDNMQIMNIKQGFKIILTTNEEEINNISENNKLYIKSKNLKLTL